jgi:predicted short-subunit dehydrogenase-like oxidoreductase (DUF2520 family)
MAFNITIIGAGNLAWNLAHALTQNGQTVLQVISQHLNHAKALADEVRAQADTRLENIDPAAQLVLLCVKDSAIAPISAKLNLGRQILAHCSGSTPMQVLHKSSFHYGVFYPVQTFNKNELKDFRTIPICVEGSDTTTENTLTELAELLSNEVQTLNSSQRLMLHLAAVIANNFTNYLYGTAHELLEQHHLSPKLLYPLITAALQDAQRQNPHGIQTGPAKRNDTAVIAEHLQLLQQHPDALEAYRLLTTLIQKKHTSTGE